MYRSILKHLSGIIAFSLIYYASVNFAHIWGPIKRRPFLCEDPSIMGPYLKDTIDSRTLYIIGLYIPAAVIILNEFLQCKKKSNFKWCGRYLIGICTALLPFLYGFATERLLKNVVKYTVGRLRPHFYTLCQPVTANGLHCVDDPDYKAPFYVTDYTCSSTSPRLSNSTFSSFPSGHSSLSFYGMIFTIMYLQRFSKRVHRNVTTYGLLLVVVQLFCFILAVSVAVSRYFDFKHFCSDIFAGTALGTLVALAFSYYREKYMQEIELLMEEGLQDLTELSVGKETSAGSVGLKHMSNGEEVSKELSCSIVVGEN